MSPWSAKDLLQRSLPDRVCDIAYATTLYAPLSYRTIAYATTPYAPLSYHAIAYATTPYASLSYHAIAYATTLYSQAKHHTPQTLFQNGANLDLRCVLLFLSDPSTFGARVPTKTRLNSKCDVAQNLDLRRVLLPAPWVSGSQPKHVSKPASVIKKFKPLYFDLI